MRAAFHDVPMQVERMRTVMFLVSPYVMGIIPLMQILYKNQTHPNLAMDIVTYFELAISTVTVVWDILLVFTFYNNRRVLKRVNMCGIITSSLLIRITAFCVFRLIFLIILLMKWLPFASKLDARSVSTLGTMAYFLEAFYPLLGFCLLGTQRDILNIWFPCLISSTRHGSTTSSSVALHPAIVSCCPADENHHSS
ncbi:hypothetical protein K439DRAFT_937546 [Ramaria rubella]|nr:hypothetical protein K439DRAFT_937546 [Ramaria rubella]